MNLFSPDPQRWLLLDIDGTLSPSGQIPHGETRLTASGRCGNVTIPDWVPDGLREVRNAGVRLAWYSLWGSEANKVVSPLLGLPDLPVVPLGRGADAPSFLKADGLSRWRKYRLQDRFVIIDDDMPDEVVGILPENVIVRRVDPREGVTWPDLAGAVERLLA